MGYFRQALVSVSWVSAFRITNRVLGFLRTLLLARLLTPTQFGNFGIAAMVLGFVEIFTETGINVFLVQQEDDRAIHHYLNTAWTVSIFRGLIISLIVALSSWPLSHFFNNPTSQQLILLIAIVPLIRGFINPATATFQKHLQFNKEFLFRTIITFTDAVIAITVAFTFKTSAAFIWGLIAGASTEVLLSHLFVKPSPRFTLIKHQVKSILHSGKWVTTAGIAAYFATNGPDISIGKILSTQSLGIYQMAYKFSVMFVDELSEMINRVAFPVYTRIGGDPERLKKAFLKTAGAYILIASLLMAGVALFAKPIVTIMLGPAWAETTQYLRMLCLVGIATAVAASTNPLFLAVKKQSYLSQVVLVQLAAFGILLIPVLAHPSLHLIILAFLISILACMPLRFFYAYKILKS